MRATIVHNPSAGAGLHRGSEVVEAVRRAGYRSTYHSSKEGSFRAALQDPGAVVVVAGGDGTVSKVALELRGSGVPIVILPLGTANNIAGALGVPASWEASLRLLVSGEDRRITLGIAGSPKRKRRFVEGFGFGLSAAIMQMDPGVPEADPTAQLSADLRRWHRVAEAIPPARYDIRADGRDLSGDYILVEVMNIPLLGPRLRLAPDADPADDRLELVLVAPEDRARLVGYLEERERDEGARFGGLTLSAREIEIRPHLHRARLDDDVWRSWGPRRSGANVVVRTARKNVVVRVPAGGAPIASGPSTS
jgi:diacylglycerol kinase (ATP)